MAQLVGYFPSMHKVLGWISIGDLHTYHPRTIIFNFKKEKKDFLLDQNDGSMGKIPVTKPD